MIQPKHLVTLKAVPVLLLITSGFSSVAMKQSVPPENAASLTCTVSDGTKTKLLPAKVTLPEFQKLGCIPNFSYFIALDNAPPEEYKKLRGPIKWSFQRIYSFKGGVTAGSEEFTANQGISVSRVYTTTSITVSVANGTDRAIFVEGSDRPNHEPTDISGIAYVAVPARKKGMIYRIDATIADPVWPSGEMGIKVLVEP